MSKHKLLVAIFAVGMTAAAAVLQDAQMKKTLLTELLQVE